MSYRFNSGRGGVTCDKCNILIDEDLSIQEYLEYKDAVDTINIMNGLEPVSPDLCMKCKQKEKT